MKVKRGSLVPFQSVWVQWLLSLLFWELHTIIDRFIEIYYIIKYPLFRTRKRWRVWVLFGVYCTRFVKNVAKLHEGSECNLQHFKKSNVINPELHENKCYFWLIIFISALVGIGQYLGLSSSWHFHYFNQNSVVLSALVRCTKDLPRKIVRKIFRCLYLKFVVSFEQGNRLIVSANSHHNRLFKMTHWHNVFVRA